MPSRKSNILATSERSKQAPSKKPRRSNNSKRSHDAYTIALQDEPSEPKTRASRLGQLEDDGSKPRQAGRRQADDAEDDDEEKSEIESGSDSEGNNWHIGQVASDEDSEIDSDEAFGESDEERFEGFVFRGSTSTAVKRDVDADSDIDSEDEDEVVSRSTKKSQEADATGEVLGEEAIDLGDLLDEFDPGSDNGSFEDENDDGDDDSSIDEETATTESRSRKRLREPGSDSESDLSASDNEDNYDSKKLSNLRKLVENLEEEIETQKPKRRRIGDTIESMNPSEHAITTTEKLTIADLMATVTDPQLKSSLALLDTSKDATRASKKKSTIPGKLDVPLPKRQQDRIDRSAAYKQSKETLNRWIDTVKHNRRAEHLSFPLQNPGDDYVDSFKRLSRAEMTPLNEFESKLKKIMQDSGLDDESGTKDEEKFMALENLQVRKFSAQEIEAKRIQMRKARDLIFREEMRAKRIKKIKSKAYRRVHRKQRYHEQLADQQARIEEGEELGKEDQEVMERMRAEQRMSTKARSSQWVKNAKNAGRLKWDHDLRGALSAAAAREDTLQRRVKGQLADDENSDQYASDQSDSDGDAETSGNGLLQELKHFEGEKSDDESTPFSRLANQPFMKRAREVKRRENEELMKDIKRTLADSDGSARESSPDIAGRRTYGPKSVSQPPNEKNKKPKAGEFDEGFLSEDEEALDGLLIDKTPVNTQQLGLNPRTKKAENRLAQKNPVTHTNLLNFTSTSNNEKDRKRSQETNAASHTSSDSRTLAKTTNGAHHIAKPTSVLSQGTLIGKTPPKSTKKVKIAKKVKFLNDISDDNDSEIDTGTAIPTAAIPNQDLFQRAFGGADAAAQFEEEKRAVMEEEDDQIIDRTLPGWGSWTGDGISKKQKKRQQTKPKVLEVVKGVAKDNRKDAKLDRVIINEKKVKKNAKYLASSLPHPYESQQQYERAMRLPVGPEWTTKETFQDATKPRLLMKQGVIAPMSRPVL